MVKALPILVFLALAGTAPQALTQTSRTVTPTSGQSHADQAPIADDPLKLDWFSRTVDSILTGRPDPDERDGTGLRK